MNVIKKIINEFYCFVFADRIILKYPIVKAVPNRINLLEYNIDLAHYKHYNDNPYNLGDCLNRLVVEYMLNRRGLSLDDWVKKKKFFISVGSGVLASYQNATFWGTGVERTYPKYRAIWHSHLFRKLDIRAVRGPLSRDYVLKLGHKCPAIYGDPAILMPYIYKAPSVKKEYDYAIIPQFSNESEIRKSHPHEKIISMNTNDYRGVINEILSCNKIITSSLHGIILAEAYGIPAVWFRGLMEIVDFKYLDYYYSTGRFNIPIATTIDEAISIEPLPIPNLGLLQEGLLKSFPYDLWENNM